MSAPTPHTLRLFADDDTVGQSPTVPRRSVHPPETTPPTPRLFDDGGPAPRIDTAPPTADELTACFEQLAEEYADPFPRLDDAERERCRTEHTLASLYWQYLDAFRRQQVADGQLAARTAQKERLCVRRFEQWDSDTARKPDRWPAHAPWRGLPVAYLTPRWIEAALESLVGVLAPATIDSTWKQLRGVLTMLERLGAIDRVPKPVRLPTVCDDLKNSEVDIYEAEELEAWFQLLPTVELQAAVALGLVGGPRTEDLFGLRWAGTERGALGLRLKVQEFQSETIGTLTQHGECLYLAQKTRKKHWFPLPAWTAAWLERLIQWRPPLFPREPGSPVFAGLCDEPQQRQATKEIKRAQKRAGVRVRHLPIQVLRATCGSRADDHREQLGFLLLHGKDADVHSRHYQNVQRKIREGVLTLKQPPAFESIVG